MNGRPGRACRRAAESLPLHYYGALRAGEAAALERHLAACPACRRAWEETRSALAAVDAASAFPREAAVDWRDRARRTVLRARAADAAAAGARAAGGTLAARLAAWFPPPARWAAAAAALLVAIVMLVPPRAPRPGPRGPVAEDPAGAARFLEGRLARHGAARYLGEGRTLLIHLMQAPLRCRRDGGDVDIRLEKERAGQLLRRKGLYAGRLTGLEDMRLAALVAQLETVLLQVSALDDCAPARQIRDLREAIERRQILLRIDLMTGSLGTGGGRA